MRSLLCATIAITREYDYSNSQLIIMLKNFITIIIIQLFMKYIARYTHCLCLLC